MVLLGTGNNMFPNIGEKGFSPGRSQCAWLCLRQLQGIGLISKLLNLNAPLSVLLLRSHVVQDLQLARRVSVQHTIHAPWRDWWVAKSQLSQFTRFLDRLGPQAAIGERRASET